MEPISARLQEEYELETERKRGLLSRAGIAEDDLSKNGQMYLHVLSEAADLLQLKDTRTSSYIMGISELIHRVDAADNTERALDEETADAHEQSKDLATEWDDLEQVKQRLEDAAHEREAHENTTTMTQRAAEYTERERTYEQELQALDAALADLEFDTARDRIEHHKLAALERACEEVETRNDGLRKQLSPFHALPLHKDLAAATLRQAQEDLAQLEDEFNRHIRAMV